MRVHSWQATSEGGAPSHGPSWVASGRGSDRHSGGRPGGVRIAAERLVFLIVSGDAFSLGHRSRPDENGVENRRLAESTATIVLWTKQTRTGWRWSAH